MKWSARIINSMDDEGRHRDRRQERENIVRFPRTLGYVCEGVARDRLHEHVRLLGSHGWVILPQAQVAQCACGHGPVRTRQLSEDADHLFAPEMTEARVATVECQPRHAVGMLMSIGDGDRVSRLALYGSYPG